MKLLIRSDENVLVAVLENEELIQYLWTKAQTYAVPVKAKDPDTRILKVKEDTVLGTKEIMKLYLWKDYQIILKL